MSATTTHYTFAGPARCTRRGTLWQIEGVERDTRRTLSMVLVCLDGDGSLPGSVADLELRCIAGAAPARWLLRWAGGSLELALRSIHVQRAGRVALAEALPGLAPSWRGRIGWALLLNLVRVPGMTRLLQALRGAG